MNTPITDDATQTTDCIAGEPVVSVIILAKLELSLHEARGALHRLCMAVSRRMMPDEPTPDDRMELRAAYDSANALLEIATKHPGQKTMSDQQRITWARRNDRTVQKMLLAEQPLTNIIYVLAKEKQEILKRIMEHEMLAPKKIALQDGSVVITTPIT